MPSRRQIFLALFILSIILIFGALPDFAVKPTQDIPKPGGTLHVRDFSDSFKPNLDPATGSCVFITEQIFDGLVRLDNNLVPSPALAEYWIPEEGRNYIFFLRKGVKFHDGRELTSQDVKFSFERLIRRETNSPFREYFLSKIVGAQEFAEGKAEDVAGFKTPDKYIFEIQWRSPYVSALYLLSMSFCKILPRDLVLAQGKNFFWKPVGTGAFKFDSWVRTPQLVEAGVRLERNSAYFGKKAYLDALEFSPYYTEDQFVKKEIEVMPFLSERLARAGCQVLDGGLQNITFLMMSCHIPPLDRPSVRKALAYGIDKEKLAQAVQGGEFIRRTTNNFIPVQWPGFFPLDDAYNFSPEKARQILEEQGFFTEKDFPELVLLLPLPKNVTQLKFADELERQLDKVGISVTAKYFQSLRDVKDTRQPFLMKVDWAMDLPDPESIIMPLFQSRSEINRGNHRYASARLDKLLEEAEMERSLSRRTELFRQMEQVLVEDLPALPIYSSEQRIALQPYVRG
ncbi:MAG: ABC transporter substrate-binding protein, partial [Candidatus Aminicenantes bacterium]|nr:ABC transporter substrate-binding protein [Candidatus Aminicenantes bacterium]